MTITYTAQVATSSFSCFLKLLARWRGSIYKLLWKDFLLFASMYYALSFLYRFILNESQRQIFEMIVQYCDFRNGLIPVAFVLGFYVSVVMTRYWTQLGHIPWPDHMAMFVTANVQGLDERGRLMRRTMLRYINLAYAITMSSISKPVKKRFPSLDHLINAGLLTANEKHILDRIQTPHNKFFIPLGWTTSLVTRARKEGRIKDDFAVKTLIDEINEFRMHLATLFVYDMISMPLVYTQVVTIAVYTFFLACLMGRQFVHDDQKMPDMYFPVFTFLEYLFYMGWLKVAECFVNPFGEDEDDFDMNFLIDRNLQVSYLIVDEIHNEHPELIRDQYWDNVVFNMPYTMASQQFRVKNPLMGSAVDLTMTEKEKELSPLETVEELEEVNTDGDQIDTPGRRHASMPTSSSHGAFFNRPSKRSHMSRSDSRQTAESPVARSVPFASFTVGSVDTVFPAGSPTTTYPKGKNHTSPPQSPLPAVDEAMQFPMDEDFTESKESEPLLEQVVTPSGGSVPPEVFEMKAILGRSLSSKTPSLDDELQSPLGDERPATDTKNQKSYGPQLSSVHEAAESTSDTSSPRKSPRLTLVMPSLLTEQQQQPPAEQTDASQTAAADGARRQPAADAALPSRQRYVAPSTATPDIPLSPELTTPLWVLAPEPPLK